MELAQEIARREREKTGESGEAVRIITHSTAVIPDAGSFEVRLADGRESVYFYWDDNVGRRSVSGKPTRDEALRAATSRARTERERITRNAAHGGTQGQRIVCNVYSSTTNQVAMGRTFLRRLALQKTRAKAKTSGSYVERCEFTGYCPTHRSPGKQKLAEDKMLISGSNEDQMRRRPLGAGITYRAPGLFSEGAWLLEEVANLGPTPDHDDDNDSNQ